MYVYGMGADVLVSSAVSDVRRGVSAEGASIAERRLATMLEAEVWLSKFTLSSVSAYSE